jgi:hypothetical protein
MRTVLTLFETGVRDAATQAEKFMINVELHATDIQGMKIPKDLDMAPLPGWDTPNAVAARGCQLRDALRKHPGVAAVLDSLGTLPPGSRAPIYVKLSQGDAELMAWETLCDSADKFVALDKRWPIGRITDPAATITRTPPLFRVPVKILAVISAFGIAGQEREWETLRDAADAAIAAGLPLEVRVLTGDPAVHALVTSDSGAGRPWASVAPVEETGAKVLASIARWQPNIVHFFCHGRATQNMQQLELARGSDVLDASLSRGSVIISGDQLASFGDALDNPWLMVLNCCEGAQASRESLSLAHRVVSAAFPAAFAMLEPVDANDAHEFTQALYGALLRELRTVKTQLDAGQFVWFEWATVTYEARDALNALHQGDAAARREWALPALYVRGREPMAFQSAPPAATDVTIAAQKAALQAMVEWLQGLKDSDLSEDRRKQAMSSALTKAGVPQALWPNVDGSFNA